MEEQLIPIGILVILIGFVLLIIGIALTAFKGKTRTEGGFIFFIGPFPVLGGATSKEIFYVLLIASIALLVIFLLLGKRLIF
ncbi:MAG: DUF131 domain-containing protein [Candidatus Aenigmarchaeota archaeon]|nr:DUF131 domain-containing protein [Candidatus Aenigmarchaeota archaeon]